MKTCTIYCEAVITAEQALRWHVLQSTKHIANTPVSPEVMDMICSIADPATSSNVRTGVPRMLRSRLHDWKIVSNEDGSFTLSKHLVFIRQCDVPNTPTPIDLAGFNRAQRELAYIFETDIPLTLKHQGPWVLHTLSGKAEDKQNQTWREWLFGLGAPIVALFKRK